jgi:hypothetical protein
MDKLEYQSSIFDEIPGRVFAAIFFASLCKSITDPESDCGSSNVGRPLRPVEDAAYTAAIRLMGMYFNGEADFAGPAMMGSLDDETFGDDLAAEDSPQSVPAVIWCGAD